MTVADLLVELGVDATGLSRGMTDAEKTIERIGTQMFFLGSRITAGVGVPLTALIGGIGKFGLEFDKAMTESLAIMSNVTPEIRAQMADVAKEISTTTKFSAEEAAKGYFSLASAGLDAATSMGALPIAARFAQAGVFDLAQASEYLAAAQAAMGAQTDSAAQKVEDMARIADVLTQANNMALGTVRDFADALTNKAGQQLRLFNKDIEEGTAVLAAYASQGIVGKNAGQQLFMTIRDLARANISNTDAWKKNNIAVFDASGNMRHLADIIKDMEVRMENATDKQRRQILMMLGMQDRSLAATQALIGFSDAIRVYEEGLRNAGGVTQDVADKQMQAFSNQLKALWHDLQVTAIELFEAFVPTLQQYVLPALRQGIDMLKGFGDFIAGLPPPLKLAALGIAGIGIAAGPVIAVLGSMTLLLGGAMRGVSMFTSGVGQLATTLGTAAGGVQQFANMTQGMTMAQTAVTGALGLTGRATQNVVLNTVQLRQAQQLAADAAMAGARAMGMNAANIANAGLEARIAVTQMNRLAQGQAAANAVIAAGSSNTTLFARALGFLTNPITLVVGGLGLLAGAILLYKQQTEAAYDEVIRNADTIRKQNRELETSIDTYTSLSFIQEKNTVEQEKLERATASLAKATGLSKEAFKAETQASDTLIQSLRQQLQARQDLFDEVANRARNVASDAAGRVGAIQAEIDKVLSGQAKVRTQEGLVTFERPLSMDERVREIARLTKELEEAKKAADDASDAVTRLMGGSLTNINLAREGARTDTGQALTLTMEQVRDRFKAAQAELTARLKASGADAATIATEVGKLNAAWADILTPKRTGVDVPEAEDPRDRMKRMIKDMKDMLTGTGGQDLQVLQSAWNQLMTESGGKIAQNADAVDRLWQQYAKLRAELNQTVPEFEELMASQIELAARNQFVNENINLWGQTWSDNAIKFVDSAAQISVATANMQPRELDAFFKKHAGTIDELALHYDELPPIMQRLIDVWQTWKISVADSTGELSAHAQKVKESINDFSTSVSAKLVDAQTELSLFSANYADRELAGLRKGLASQERELDKSYKERIQMLAGAHHTMSAAEFMHQLSIINETRENGERMLAIQERIGALRLASSVGINDRLIRENDRYTTEEIKQLIKIQDAVNEFFRILNANIAGLRAMGDLATALGMESFGSTLGAMASGASQMSQGLQQATQIGASFSEQMTGWITVGVGVVNMFNSLRDAASTTERVLSGALTGMQIGAAFGGGVGAAIGAGFGALFGWLVGKSQWRQLQDDIAARWGVHVDDELAKRIRETSERVGGEVEGMLLHIGEIIEQGGGVTAENVNDWARRLRDAFSGVQTGSLSSAQAAGILDQAFGDLADKGRTTTGILSGQVLELIKLEQQYKTGSQAIKDFVQQQLNVAAGGFEKVVGGVFGALLKDVEDAQNSDDDDAIAKLEQRIEDFANNGQEDFDRLGRFASAIFAGMTSSGMSVIQALEAMGPSLDMLRDAQEKFGFASSGSLDTLLRFREFINMNPELAGMMTGLQEMMTGLHNSGFMTQELFMDLGAQITDTFDRAVAGGLSSDEAMRLMQPTLQTLWELQQHFGYAVDEATQLLLDQAEASGVVGQQYMSANDRMVLGIDRLNQLMETFLRHLGVDIPDAAGVAGDAIRDELTGIDVPPINIPYRYYQEGPGPSDFTTEAPEAGDLPAYGWGAHLSQGPHVAVVGDSDEWIIRDPAFRGIMAGAAEVGAQSAGGGGNMTVIEEGGVQVTITAPYVTTQAEWVSKEITREVLVALGNNDEPGYEDAVRKIVNRVLEESRQ